MTLNNKQNEDIELIMIIEQLVETPVETDRESEKGDETDEKINDLTFPLSIDSEDFCGTTLDDATTDKMHLPNTE